MIIIKIAVVGCGKIGTSIIENLTSEGHDVTAVDINNDLVSSCVDLYDCMGVCGSGTDCDTLVECGAGGCNLFVAVTGSDEFNMLSCFMAKQLGAEHTIARIRNPEYNDKNLTFMRERLGLSMSLNPEMLAAGAIFDNLKLPGAVGIETFSRRRFEMIQLNIKEGSSLDGMSLINMRKSYKAKFLVCVVKRGEEVVVPDGNFVLKSGDRVAITASPYEIEKLLKLLDLTGKKAKNVMILGASRTAFYLAQMLLKSGNAVKVIDEDKKRLEEFCEHLPGIVAIEGDGAKQEVLLEEGIGNMDAFTSLTGIDEENILLSLFATTQNVKKVIAKIDRDEFSSLAEKIGIESHVSPRKIVADIIVRYARGLENSMGNKMETLYKIMDGKAEVMEFGVTSESDVTGITLKDITLKKNILIAGIVRNRKTIIPTGDDSIQVGDMVIVLAAGVRINDITDIIK